MSSDEPNQAPAPPAPERSEPSALAQPAQAREASTPAPPASEPSAPSAPSALAQPAHEPEASTLAPPASEPSTPTPAPPELARGRRRVLALALLLGALATALVLHNQRDVGVARDETVYLAYGARYAAWWSGVARGDVPISRATITSHFGGAGATDNNREHPPLMKTVAGLSARGLHGQLRWLDELTAARLPSALLHGLLVALILLFGARAWGLSVGALAAALMLMMPRPLFHAGLACFDGPITTLWFATVWAYFRALATGRGAWLAGACFGLALATKHNALLLPAALGAHYLALAWRARRATADDERPGAAAAALRLARAAATLRPGLVLALAALGPAVLVALWPWLWFDTAAHLRDWIAFHLHHVHYNFEYLGENWNAPPFPWHVALVTTWFTVPTVTLAASLIGARVWLGASPPRDDAQARAAAHRPALLLVCSAAVAAGPFFLGQTPIFGAEKHWEPAMPSLCLAAALGLVTTGRQAARWLGRRWPRWRKPRWAAALVATLALVAVASAAVETLHPQPYGLTAYNALAGGAPGAADRGMNRQFWGVAARGVLDEVARDAPPPGAPPVWVYTHDASPAWGVYARLGLIPPGLQDAGLERAGIERSSLALVVHERHFARHDYLIWQAYGTVQPSFVLRLDGVPLVSVYRRPPVPAPPSAPASALSSSPAATQPSLHGDGDVEVDATLDAPIMGEQLNDGPATRARAHPPESTPSPPPSTSPTPSRPAGASPDSAPTTPARPAPTSTAPPGR
ncbi:MAG: glycosyltransferase family 39 protein [Kofleriaceae bacterium]